VWFEPNLVQNTNTTLSTRRNGQIYINWKSNKWRRPPSWISEKISITLDWIKISCIKLYGKMQHGHAEMTTWPNVETGSLFAWRHQMKVWSIHASISVTITDIWPKFGTEHKYHTIITQEWPNAHKLNIQDGGDRHLEFQKKMSITLKWIKISCMK